MSVTATAAPRQVKGRESIIEDIPLYLLVVDRHYQRSLNNGLLATIAQGFNPKLVGIPVVSSRENGNYAVLDGQHRVMGAKQAGVESIRCQVFFDLSPQDEAMLFVDLNIRRVAVGSLDRFKALVEAGDPVANDISLIVYANGLKVGGKPHIGAVAALYQAHGWGTLGESLRIITEAWPGDEFSLRREMILAVASMLAHYRTKLNRDRFLKVLRKRASTDYLQLAKQAAAVRSGYDWALLAENFALLYNRVSQKDPLPAFVPPKKAVAKAGVYAPRAAQSNPAFRRDLPESKRR